MGDYANACMPMQNREKAFFSGYMPTEEMGRMTFTVPVRDTEPMWLYCTQGKHCQEGMVAVVNPYVLLPSPHSMCILTDLA